MVECLIIEVDVDDPQTSIQNALSIAAIPADKFLQALLLKEETKNSKAKIVIFFEQL